MRRVTAGQLEMNVRQEGQGPPLFFVHGFPLDHTMWQGQIEYFAREWRVVAPDLRGFGGSEATAGEAGMDQMADDLAALADRLGIAEPITLCGLSMGGYVAWQFWRRHRQRLARLVVADTRSVGDTAEVARGRLMMAQRVETEGKSALVEVAEMMLPKLFCEATWRERPELVEQTREVILATPPAGMAAAQRGMAARPDVGDWLAEMALPVLVVAGAEDAISPPEEMRGIAESLPSARFHVVPSAGHMAPLEQPADFNAALESFLHETSG